MPARGALRKVKRRLYEQFLDEEIVLDRIAKKIGASMLA
jgi:hypothetical protein